MNTLQMHYPESVVWDLDGTIIDSMGVFEDVIGRVAAGYNLAPPDHDMVARNYHGSLSQTIDVVMGGLDSDTLQRVVVDFLKLQDESYEAIEHHIFPDSLELMRWFSANGITQGILLTENILDA